MHVWMSEGQMASGTGSGKTDKGASGKRKPVSRKCSSRALSRAIQATR
jgi:hypothetical protein